MCDVEKYLKIYKEIKKLDPEDTLQLVLEAKDDEAKDSSVKAEAAAKADTEE